MERGHMACSTGLPQHRGLELHQVALPCPQPWPATTTLRGGLRTPSSA